MAYEFEPLSTDDEQLVDYLKETSVTNIADALKRLDIRNFRLEEMQTVFEFENPDDHIAGPAVTARFVPSHHKQGYMDSDYHHTEIIESAPEGSVVVNNSIVNGEMAGQTAVNAGVQAVVGLRARDIDAMKQLGLPTFLPGGRNGIVVNSYTGNEECVGKNVPIKVQGAKIEAGDIIVGDNDGVVVVPRDSLEDVVETVQNIEELEEQLDEWVKAGEPWSKIYSEIHHRKYIDE